MIIYVLFLGLLSQSFASFAAEALPLKGGGLTMSEAALRHFSLTRSEQKFEIFLASAPYSTHFLTGDLLESDLAGNPELKDKYTLVKEAIRAGNLPKKVRTHINAREGVQLLLESPHAYLHRLLVSHRARAQSEPMPEVASLASESVSLPRPVSLPTEVFSHARVSSPVIFAAPGSAESTARSDRLK